jgi:hypothetical protein
MGSQLGEKMKKRVSMGCKKLAKDNPIASQFQAYNGINDQ